MPEASSYNRRYNNVNEKKMIKKIIRHEKNEEKKEVKEKSSGGKC